MDFLQTLSIALAIFSQHKLRTFLSALGITIGVFTVIVIYSAVNGLNTQVETQFRSIGTELIQVSQYSWVGEEGSRFRMRKERPKLTLADAEAIKELAPHINKVAPTGYSPATVSYNGEDIPMTLICGTNEQLTDIEGYFAEQGRFMSETEVSHNRYVAVIGADIVTKLFPVVDPIGKYLKIGGLKFLIIGALESKGALLGSSQDDIIFIPFGVFTKVFGSRRGITISCMADNPQNFIQAIEDVRFVMRTRHGLKHNDPDDFAINTSEQLVETYRKITGTAFLVMILVGAISLLVGGIGIMNIMYVSVTERTFEIGLRKALGATQKVILTQFLIEAIVVCLTGGILGMTLGILVSILLDKATPMPAVISIPSVVVGVLFMVIVGLIFGLLPARKAAKLPPIEALRYE